MRFGKPIRDFSSDFQGFYDLYHSHASPFEKFIEGYGLLNLKARILTIVLKQEKTLERLFQISHLKN